MSRRCTRMEVQMRAALAWAVGCFCAGSASAADVDALTRTFEERIAVSMQAYRDQSTRIADEKIPLVREINRLEDENLALREQIGRAQQVTTENNTSFDALRNRLEERRAQTSFAQRYLREYLDTFESRLNTAEDQHYKGRLTEIRRALEPAKLDLGTSLQHQLASIELGLDRAEQLVGGYQFDGAGITPPDVEPAGILKPGTIFVTGPSAYFSDAKLGGTLSGMLRPHLGTIEPLIVPVSPADTRAITQFMQNRGGPVPLDASLGNAGAVQSANVKLAEHVRSGGPVGFVIIALGVIAAVLGVIKVFDLRRFRSVSAENLQQIIREARAHHEAAAIELARKVSGPVSEMLEVGVRNLGGNPVLLEDMMLSVMLRRRPEAERFLGFLAVTAVASPLLGLLGTVSGMIHTFSLIYLFGAGDPRALSSGISEALVTTEFGLLVAIPAVAAHGILARMVKSRLGDMERVAFEFVKTLTLEASNSSTVAR